MDKLREDRDVTNKKLDRMELLHPSDKKYLRLATGTKVLLVDGWGNVVVYLCLFKISEKNYGCFLVPSVLVKMYKVPVARMVQKVFESELGKLKESIIQTVSKNVTIINRWMKFLKFNKCESIEVPGFTGEYFIWRRLSYGS